jgi:hypothetical protein
MPSVLIAVVRVHRTVVTLGLLIVGLVASDFIGVSRRFWGGHSVLAGAVTNLLIAMVILLGVERIVITREHRRWREVALIGLHDIDCTLDVAMFIDTIVSDWTDQKHKGKVPDGRSYDDTLIEALGDPETWRGDPEEMGPALMDFARGKGKKLEELFLLWAPVFIRSAELTSLANQIPDIIFSSRQLIMRLEVAEELAAPGKSREDWIFANELDVAEGLVESLKHYERLTSRYLSESYRYRDGTS